MFRFDRCVLAIAAALLAACGGSQLPIAPGTMVQSRAIAPPMQRGGSWMLPEAKGMRRLLYVSDWAANDVEVYNYDSGREVGTLGDVNAPAGQCVDKAGNIWIAQLAERDVVEYARGGKSPMKILVTDGSGVGCSIDPTTGNLAVVNFEAGKGSDIQIWKNATGTPTDYSNLHDCYEMWSPGYDRHGNLFAENGNVKSACELKSGISSSLKAVSFDEQICTPGGVMWDGKYLTFTDEGYDCGLVTTIYRVMEKRGRLVTVGKTVLHEKPCGASVAQPFIVGKRNTPANREQGYAVVGANPACYSPYNVAYWHYPGGGRPFMSFYQEAEGAEGASVSIKE